MKTVEITKESGIPLMGNIAFGIIDRGSSLLQVRPISTCNLSCIFCSTDAGPNSSTHKTGYKIEPNYLIEEVNKIIELKQEDIHVNIDSVGEPASYPDLEYLIKELKKNKKVHFISMQSNGTYFTKDRIDRLEKAGLNRIHLSIHTTDPVQAKILMGIDTYDLKKVLEVAEHISKSKIELLLAPVYLPNINDKDLENIIILSKKLNCKLGIQKYETYKHSRKPKGIKKQNYYKFYKQLEEWEKKHDVKLTYQKGELEIEKSSKVGTTIDIGEKINTPVLEDGWFENQKIVAHNNRNITVKKCSANRGDKINLRIIENKNNIYLAEKI